MVHLGLLFLPRHRPVVTRKVPACGRRALGVMGFLHPLAWVLQRPFAMFIIYPFLQVTDQEFAEVNWRLVTQPGSGGAGGWTPICLSFFLSPHP